MKYDDSAYARLNEALLIDRDQIDEELIAQVQHFWHVAEAHEQAVSIVDQKKLELDVVEVELDKEIREQMVADGEKVTEKFIEAAVKREQDYQRAVKAYIAAKANAGRWAALRESYRHRRDVLIELSRRGQQRYFDDVTGTGETRDARERMRPVLDSRRRV